MPRSGKVEGFGYLEKLKLLQKLHKLCGDDYWSSASIYSSTPHTGLQKRNEPSCLSVANSADNKKEMQKKSQHKVPLNR